MGSIGKIQIKGKEILFLDYSFLKEAEMINLVQRARKMIEKENKPQLILSNLANAYATPGFMKAVREEVSAVLPFISKQAIIGLNTPKQWILKGLNFMLKTNYVAFETEEEAIAYLTE